jgi:hypothetical protein
MTSFVDYLMRNNEWIFSGIGVFILGLIVTVFFRQKGKDKNSINSYLGNESKQSFPLSNNISGEKINLNQTIINNSNTGNILSSTADESSEIKSNDPELLKIKERYFSNKNEFRVFLFKKLAEARNDNIRLEIRHITDAIEDELQIKCNKTLSEIEKLEEEGIIRFEKRTDESLTPYSRIRLTEKYFRLIN